MRNCAASAAQKCKIKANEMFTLLLMVLFSFAQFSVDEVEHLSSLFSLDRELVSSGNADVGM